MLAWISNRHKGSIVSLVADERRITIGLCLQEMSLNFYNMRTQFQDKWVETRGSG